MSTTNNPNSVTREFKFVTFMKSTRFSNNSFAIITLTMPIKWRIAIVQ